MGCDWYDFSTTLLGRGIAVAVKDVLKQLKKEQQKADDDDEDDEDKARPFEDVRLALEEDLHKSDPVIPADWTVLSINKRFLLISPFGDEINPVALGLEVPGPYYGTLATQVSVTPFATSQCPTLVYGKMIAVARAITGNFHSRLVFPPGNCAVSTSTLGGCEIETIRSSSSKEGVASDFCGNQLFDQIPRDVILKDKSTNETTASNLAILTFYGLNEKLLSSTTSAGDAETPEFLVDPQDLDIARLDEWVKKFGATDISKNADCVFLMGSDESNEIAVNRSALAMHNEVLCSMLYGTERMPHVDLS